MANKQSYPNFKMRFFEIETYEWVKAQAKNNNRTMTAEINYHLEQAMLKQQQEKQHVTATN